MNLSSAIMLYAYGTSEGACKAVETRGDSPASKCGGGKSGENGKNGGTLESKYNAIMKGLKDPTAGTRQNPIQVGSNLEKAAVLIAKGKHVRLNQPDQLSTLVEKIKKEAEAMRARGQKPPDWNIANISLAGTNLFAQEHLGIPRVKMPQLAGLVLAESKAAKLLPKNADLSNDEVDLAPKFIDELRRSGIRVKDVTVQASHTRASQSELDGSKVGSIAARMREGKMKFGQIFITRDNYILDGHHRWAATIVNDARDGRMGDLWMSAHKLDIDIGTALSRARAFQKRWGIAPAGMGHVMKVKASAYLRHRRRWVIGESRG